MKNDCTDYHGVVTVGDRDASNGQSNNANVAEDAEKTTALLHDSGEYNFVHGVNVDRM